jgi:hypothetical protein
MAVDEHELHALLVHREQWRIDDAGALRIDSVFDICVQGGTS